MKYYLKGIILLLFALKFTIDLCLRTTSAKIPICICCTTSTRYIIFRTPMSCGIHVLDGASALKTCVNRIEGVHNCHVPWCRFATAYQSRYTMAGTPKDGAFMCLGLPLPFPSLHSTSRRDLGPRQLLFLAGFDARFVLTENSCLIRYLF